MTASLARMEEGKATYVGRCCSSVAFPLRQGRRIQILFPRVAVISQSEGGDVGPAVTPPRGCRATLMHPGLVALPGSGAVLETPVAASFDAASSPAGAPGGHVVERVGSDATAIFILSLTKRDQLGGDLLRDGAQGLPGVGVFHVPKHGDVDEQDVAENERGLAHVCS